MVNLQSQEIDKQQHKKVQYNKSRDTPNVRRVDKKIESTPNEMERSDWGENSGGTW